MTVISKPLAQEDEKCNNCTSDAINHAQTHSKVGLYMTLGVGALALAVSLATLPFIAPAMRKHTLPYIPATPRQLSNVFKAISAYDSSLQPSKSRVVKLVDLGSGDGRIVFEAARRGYKATGIELNSILYLYTKYKTLTSQWKKPVSVEIDAPLLDKSLPLYRPVFKCADFWKVDMRHDDLIVIFGVQEMMKDLANKLLKEMKPSTLIVSCRNPITAFKSIYHLDDALDSVWIYDRNTLLKPLPLSEVKELLEKQQQQQADNFDDSDDEEIPVKKSQKNRS